MTHKSLGKAPQYLPFWLSALGSWRFINVLRSNFFAQRPGSHLRKVLVKFTKIFLHPLSVFISTLARDFIINAIYKVLELYRFFKILEVFKYCNISFYLFFPLKKHLQGWLHVILFYSNFFKGFFDEVFNHVQPFLC